LQTWYQRSEEEKFHHAFWGSSKGKGKRKLKTLRDYFRDRKIVAEIDRLKSEGMGYNQALKTVQGHLQELDISETMTFENLRRIYKDFQPDADPFRELFSFPG
jgi:hypothetical protein